MSDDTETKKNKSKSPAKSLERTDLFTEDHIGQLADLISDDSSSGDQETGPVDPVNLDDTGRFYPSKS